VFQTILALNALIYNSLGKTSIAFKISIIPNALYIVAFTVGVNFGIIGVAYSFLLVNVLLFIPLFKNAINLLDITLLEVFKVLKGIIVASFAMTALLLTLNYYLNISLTIDLFLKLILGGLTYFVFIYLFEKELILIFKNKIKNFLP
jgi:O-antigen/teichoic acid export membrane protein